MRSKKITDAYRMHKEWYCVSKKLAQNWLVQKIKVNNGCHCSNCLHYYKLLTITQSLHIHTPNTLKLRTQLEMWANAQRDGRPAEYRWRPLFNAAVWLTPTTRLPCSNAAKTQNPLKLPGVPQTNETISAASRPKFTILWEHMEEILLLNKFFFQLSICAFVAKI